MELLHSTKVIPGVHVIYNSKIQYAIIFNTTKSRMVKKRKPSLLSSEMPEAKPNDLIGAELRKLFVWGLIACIVSYCLLFLMTPFGPFDDRMQRPDRFLRLDFFLRLLDVEYLKFAWFGETNTFSFSIPFQKICLTTFYLVFCAFGLGYLPLLALRLTKRLTTCERFVFSSAIGLSFLSAFVMAIGLCGGLREKPAIFCLLICTIVGGIISIILYALRRLIPFYTRCVTGKPFPPRSKLPMFSKFVLILAIPSLLMLFFGGILPPVEYDVTSYHTPGARHFFETGRIDFVPNNVYVNMPFGAEMFSVLGMVFCERNWYLGTLIGKLLIAYCTFLAGLGIYAFGKRLHSSQAGMIGFLLYVSLPWVSWVSTAGLIDGVFGMYLLLSVFALYLYVQSRHSNKTDETETDSQQPIEQRTFLYLAGLMAGSAAACKYTAVPFLVLPLCGFALYFACKRPDAKRLQFDRRAAGMLGLFLLCVTLPCGLWYAKNLYYTGNPTYPLMYRVFGDRTGTWDATKNERWHTAHSSTDFRAAQFARDVKQTLFGSDWLAPVLVPLAVLPFLRRRQNQNRVLLALAAYITFYLVLWWLLTHRLERFWVPILPLFALLAGIGAMFFTKTNIVTQQELSHAPHRVKRLTGLSNFGPTIFVVALLIFNTAYTFFPNAVSAPGKYSRFGMGIEAARIDPNRVMPLVLHFNAHPPEGKILLVGDAEVFDYAVPVLYNTCFDDTLFDELFFEAKNHVDGHATPPFRSPDDMRKRLSEAGISHIVVNWAEIARFRSAGNYGYTSDLVQPRIFEQLTEIGVLRRLHRASESPNGVPTLPEQYVYEVIKFTDAGKYGE